MDERFYNYCQSGADGGAQGNISPTGIKEYKFPLPPIGFQQQIVDELESYQKIINGCRQVVENYKTTIDIDPSWEMLELDEVLEKITDGSHFSPKSTESGYPYITVKDLNDGGIDFANSKRISKDDYEKLLKSGCKPKKDDVLFSKDGTVGKTALIQENIDFVILSSLAILSPNIKLINPLYLYHYLSTERFINEAIDNKTGVAIRRIVLKTLKKIKIPLPNLSIQQEIVNKIEFERNLVIGNKKLIEIYNQKIKDKINTLWVN